VGKLIHVTRFEHRVNDNRVQHSRCCVVKGRLKATFSPFYQSFFLPSSFSDTMVFTSIQPELLIISEKWRGLSPEEHQRYRNTSIAEGASSRRRKDTRRAKRHSSHKELVISVPGERGKRGVSISIGKVNINTFPLCQCEFLSHTPRGTLIRCQCYPGSHRASYQCNYLPETSHFNI